MTLKGVPTGKWYLELTGMVKLVLYSCTQPSVSELEVYQLLCQEQL